MPAQRLFFGLLTAGSHRITYSLVICRHLSKFKKLECELMVIRCCSQLTVIHLTARITYSLVICGHLSKFK
jgi:hypothetical protein